MSAETTIDLLDTFGVTNLATAVAAYTARCVPTATGCLVNPDIQPNTYGELRFLGRRMQAHRAVLALAEGHIPGRDTVTRHSCDNKPCVALPHLAFGPQALNLHDQYRRGRRTSGWARGEDRPQAVLTEDVVRQMRVMARRGSRLQAIADTFGVPYSPTRAAVRGETWRHVTSEPPVVGRRNAKPNPRAYRLARQEQAQEVAALCAAGSSLAEVAARLHISRHSAWSLLRASREGVA